MQGTTQVLNVGQFGLGVPAGLLWGVFVFALVFFGVMSVLLMYHWRKYEVTSRNAWIFIGVYFVVAGLLLVAMLVSLLTYLNG